MQPISPRTYKVIFLIIFLAIGFGVFAQAPNLLNYQGVARNAVGNPLPNQAMNLRLSVHNLSASGTVVYSETRPITTNLGGLFSVQIGSAGTTSSTGTIGGVNWLSGDKYLQVEIDPISNNNYLSLGTVQLVAVPYAFNAASAGNATTATKLAAPKNINGVAFDGSADISIAAAASAELLTGTNIKSTVTGSSLTSLGTLTNLTVTNPIAGSVTGNAATATLASTVTTNANLSGDVTSVGNVTSVKQINGTALSGLSTGILKNTTTTGVPSIAVAGTDYLTPTGSAAGLTNFPTFNQKTSGNAATATKLETPKNINGVSFDGTGDITVTADAGTLIGNTLKSTVTGSSLTSLGTLTNLTVTNPIAGSVTGNAATATKLATPKNINGVAFDGSSDITIGAAAAAEQLTGTTLKSTVTGSSLTSVGTLTNLTVTNPIAGSVTGNAASATNLTGLTTSVATLNNLSGVNTGDQTTITGNAATATKLAATKNINGVAFDGSSDITIGAAAAAEQLTGTTLKSTVTGSSLTSVGTLANLTVTNPIVGSITGNAATATTATTVTTNANLTGDVTSVGNATTIADNAVTTAKIANANVTLAKLENLASGAIVVGNTSNRPTAVSISGDAVLSPTGELIIAIGAVTTSKIATGAVATASIADGAITNAKVTDVAATKITGTFTSATVNGKVIVGASSAASSSAVLEASSTTQGFLPPRMTSGQRDAISAPVAGLVVWCSDCGSNGELQVHNGTAWKNMIGGTAAVNPSILTVTNPTTGKIWMDRNLGASQVATSSTDALAYGDLYQWGRGADGHQLRNSTTTNTVSANDNPGNDNFILDGGNYYSGNPGDWRDPQNINLWQGVSGTNNPCPSGYRVPTSTEWEAERVSWSSSGPAGAFASPLKLPMAGYRSGSNGTIYEAGTRGDYWSSTIFNSYFTNFSNELFFYSAGSGVYDMNEHSQGFSVRCIKN